MQRAFDGTFVFRGTLTPRISHMIACSIQIARGTDILRRLVVDILHCVKDMFFPCTEATLVSMRWIDVPLVVIMNSPRTGHRRTRVSVCEIWMPFLKLMVMSW